MSKEIELLTEIRDLLQAMAEPALAKRDEKLREELRSLVGKGQKKAAAVLCMDGSKSQTAISNESAIDKSDLSKLVRALEAKSLVGVNEKHPKLRLTLPSNFFEKKGKANE